MAPVLAGPSIWNRGWILALLSAAAIVPLWLTEYLPLVDLPQHAAQVATLKELLAGEPVVEAEFMLNWFTPYLLAYLLLLGLSVFMPITVAAKVLVSAYVVAFPLATASLLRAAGGDARLALLSLPGAFSVAYYWGFISFLIALPVALWVLAHIVRGPRGDEKPHRWSVFLALTGLFFCHAIAFCAAGLMAAAWLFARHAPRWKELARAWVPLLLSLPIPLVWLWLTASQDTEVQAASTEFGDWLFRLTILFGQLGGQEFITPLGAVVGLLVLFGPACWGCRPTRVIARWVPLGVALTLALAMPSYVFDTVLVPERVGALIVPAWLVVWDRPQRGRRMVEGVALLVLLSWLSLSGLRYLGWEKEVASAREVLRLMQPGETVAGLVIENRSVWFQAPVYLHFPVWYQAEQGGLVDFSFADFHGPLLRYRTPRKGRVREIISWYPLLFDWKADGGDRYRYFLVRAPFDPGAGVFKQDVDKVELVSRSGLWWLYEKAEK